MKLAAAVLIAMVMAAPVLAQAGEGTPTAPMAGQRQSDKTQQGKAKPKLYDESADVKALIAAATARAKKENRRVLVQWGGNWCGWCIRLDELMKSDPEIRKYVQYEYDVVHADSGRDQKNVDLIKKYGAKAMEEGFPYLTVLDGDGNVIANQDSGSLEVKDAKTGDTSLEAGHDRAKVLAFLKQHAAKPVAAEDVLAAGLAEARSSGRSVFLHFGAPWCGWCHRLEEWMARPEVLKVLEKDFVDVKIDTDRMKGGKEMYAKYRAGPDGGIPWFVFLSPEGAAVVNSTGPKGNTGFPAADEEVEHFEAMLNKVKKKMTDADVKGLVDGLKKDAAGR